MKTCLLVFYSRTGTTRAIADAIARVCDCDVEAIREPRSRAGPIGYLRSGYEAMNGKLPVIDPPSMNPADYDVTIVGTPVWAQNISSPMRSYLMQKRNRFNRVAAFCTLGGAGGDKVLNDIETLCGTPLVAKLVLTSAQINNNSYGDQVDLFVQSFTVMA